MVQLRSGVPCSPQGPGIQNLLIIPFFQDGPIFFFLQSVIREQVDAVTFGEGQSDKSTETEEGLWDVGRGGSQTGICLPFKPGILLLQSLY